MTTSRQLQRLAATAARDPFFLGMSLEQHRLRHQYSEPQLAEHLGLPPERLPELFLCRAIDPETEDFVEQVDQVASAFSCNASSLLKLLREEAVLAPLQTETSTASSVTLAARDRKPSANSEAAPENEAADE